MAKVYVGLGSNINPEENLVIAVHSALEKAYNREDAVLQRAMFDAVASTLRTDLSQQ